jgi:hypothetical protein
MRREAVISDDGKYRYTLYRDWSDEDEVDKLFYGVRVLNFVMLNPSTADGKEDDPTIRKCIGFAKLSNFNAIRVVNLFAFRATDPRDLKAAYNWNYEVVGPSNDDYVREIPPEETVVAAWGSTFKNDTFRQRRVRETVALLSRKLYCLKKTPEGNPWHPLYVPYGPIIEF